MPLAGAILCCTSIPPEQRVRIATPFTVIKLIPCQSQSSEPSARRWVLPSNSISPRT